MTVIAVDKDAARRTMRVTVEVAAPLDRVWQLWADPRLLERWWGPPTYPATFESLELVPGGTAAYYMTGPDGDQPHGWWKVLVVDAPHHLEVEDGFAEPDATPLPDMPTTHMSVDLEAADGVTRMSITSTFPSTEAMEKLVEMGMEEGMREALGQIDAILAEVSATS